jgi:hypothetical protein
MTRRGCEKPRVSLPAGGQLRHKIEDSIGYRNTPRSTGLGALHAHPLRLSALNDEHRHGHLHQITNANRAQLGPPHTRPRIDEQQICKPPIAVKGMQIDTFQLILTEREHLSWRGA